MTRTNALYSPDILRLFVAWSLLTFWGCSESGMKPGLEASAVTEPQALFTGNPIQYGYDAAGRLVAVYDPNGNSAQYVYDAAGNILSVTQYTASTLAIFDVSPVTGPTGSSVTITGSGFSTTPSSNTVKFNGTAATVNAATAQQLVVTVPSGATTGTISVTVSSTTKTSAQTFTVGASGPSITSFTPTLGNANTAITVTGSGFQASIMDNAASVGSQFANVTTATSTQLKLLAPLTSGKVRVTTPTGTAISTQDFFQLPSGVSSGSVAYSGRIAVDGASLPVSFTGSTSTGLVLFDANVNDRLGLAVTAPSTGDSGTVMLAVTSIDESNLTSWYVYNNSNSYLSVPILPTSGTFQMALSPINGATDCNVTLTMSHPLTGTLAINGPAITFSTSRPGQQGIYNFRPSAGSSLTLSVYNSTFAGNLSGDVEDPNGNEVVGIFDSSYSIDLVNLAAGSYNLIASPVNSASGQVVFLLTSDASGSAGTENGSATTLNQNAYQNGRYTFTATAGDYVGFGVSSFTTTPASTLTSFELFDPTNSEITACSFSAAGSCSFGKLSTTGTYTIAVDPQTAASVSMQVLISKALTGSFTVGGTGATFNTSRVGQDGIYTFTATSGQNVTISLTSCSFPSGITGQVYDSGNTWYGGVSCSPGSPGSQLFSGLAAGTYSVVLVPTGTDTGSVTVSGS